MLVQHHGYGAFISRNAPFLHGGEKVFLLLAMVAAVHKHPEKVQDLAQFFYVKLAGVANTLSLVSHGIQDLENYFVFMLENFSGSHGSILPLI